MYVYVSGTVLEQGCTVGLQLLQNDLWLGCPQQYCIGKTCPGVCFDGADWNNCWGEVFKMYHSYGAGPIRSGDFVGLFYPRENKWFSMYQNRGHKQTCPGSTPTVEFGFHRQDSWYYCGAEVFQVFAKGKANGVPITDQDLLTFYFPAAYSVVKFLPDQVITSSCMIDQSSHALPPTVNAYDQCKWESVEITIFD